MNIVPIKSPHRIKDITGQTFNYLTVIKLLGKSEKARSTIWEAQCICGKITQASRTILILGQKKSCGCKRGLEKGEAALNRVIEQYTRRAKKERNIEFTLSKEEFKNIVSKNCIYCNIIPQQISRPGGERNTGNFLYNGIDRINNSKGYILENCVPCCGICNSIKGKYLTQDDMFTLIESRKKNLNREDPWLEYRNDNQRTW